MSTPNLEHFHHPQKKLCTKQQLFSLASSPQPLVATNLPSVSMGFPILDISFNGLVIIFKTSFLNVSYCSKIILIGSQESHCAKSN